MKEPSRLFKIAQPLLRPPAWGDVVVFLGLGTLLYLAIRLGMGAPEVIQGPEINLSPGVLPYYVGLSLGRMFCAYVLSMVFSMVFGYLAAKNQTAEKFLLPLLDVLQSVPLLSFLPVVFLSTAAVLPLHLALELSSIVLIFTSQAWNIAFAWYQSLTTIPRELRLTSTMFRFSTWLRFKTLELPFAAITLIWNSMASWAGGWFFLMASEMFTAGERNFRLPGLGSYLQEAANQGNLQAVMYGLGALVLTILALDQFIWRPLLAWSDRFKMQFVESENPPTSWFYNALRSSRMFAAIYENILKPVSIKLDPMLLRLSPGLEYPLGERRARAWPRYLLAAAALLALAVLLYEAYQGGRLLMGVSLGQWGDIGIGLVATQLRVLAALLIALAWTIPAGVLIGTSPRLANWLQPLVQVTASIPATALFPVLLLLVVHLPGELDLAAVLLMLLGTQWYLLFNIIAGASAIPQDLKYTTALLQLGRWERWKTLFLPALFPYAVTGAIAAAGGAWNASIVSEYTQFGGRVLTTTGIGAIIAQATAEGDYPQVLAATLALIVTVCTLNRLVWRRLYNLAEERYRF
ncbi:MAG: ABC transporter permease subunit [Deltaproteobacteria bacterium]|nr:ABC transporter permease subunit [Deltaproteobacteria bacterium]